MWSEAQQREATATPRREIALVTLGSWDIVDSGPTVSPREILA